MDYYKCLQVDQEADQEIIDMAYKKLSMKYHPDKNNSKKAHELMCVINEAYETLSNPTARQAYNRLLNLPQNFKKSTSNHNALIFEKNKEAIQVASNYLKKYFEYIKNQNYSRAYQLIHPAHRKELSYSHFKKWQHMVSMVYEIKEFYIEPKAIDFNVISGNHEISELITFDVVVEEFNQIMDQIERDRFQKYLVLYKDEVGIFLDQLDVFEVMNRFEKLNQLKKGRLTNVKKWIQGDLRARNSRFFNLIDLEVERYMRYDTPFSIVFFKIDIQQKIDPNKTYRHIKEILMENTRRLDKLSQLESNLYAVMLPGTLLDEGRLFADKINEIISERESLLTSRFTMKCLVIENKHKSTQVALEYLINELDNFRAND